MKLRMISEEISGHEPSPELRLVLDAIDAQLGQIIPTIVVRNPGAGSGSEANIFIKGDRRQGVTIYVHKMGPDRSGRGAGVVNYRALTSDGHQENSKDPMDIIKWAVQRLSGQASQSMADKRIELVRQERRDKAQDDVQWRG